MNASPEEIESRRAEIARQRETAQEEYDQALRWVMSTRRGRRVFRRLFEVAGNNRCSFTGNSETFFKEGQRNVGLTFLADIERLCPEDYVKLLLEGRSINPNKTGRDPK